MAEIPLVDTHFHLHDMRYSWLNRTISMASSATSTRSRRSTIGSKTISRIASRTCRRQSHVQAALGIPDPVNETKWIRAFADKTGYPHQHRRGMSSCQSSTPQRCLIVTCITPTCEASGISAMDATLDGSWRAGFKHLKRHNLVSCVDTRIQYFNDLSTSPVLFRHDDLVDHCAIPEARDDEYLKRWSAAMRTLAKADNVVMESSASA